jgi:solute carrier family 9B (sodium/hydrogen exchanger), member 1/2
MAVLSVLITAPPGAIAISLWGEKVLEKEELTGYRFFTLRDTLKLPRVGQRVRHKRTGAVWKVIEEMEIWVPNPAGAGVTTDQVPALALRFWKVDARLARGRGKTLRHSYTPGDHTFERYWEILEA